MAWFSFNGWPHTSRKQKSAKLFSLNPRRPSQPIATINRRTKSTEKKTFAPFSRFGFCCHRQVDGRHRHCFWCCCVVVSSNCLCRREMAALHLIITPNEQTGAHRHGKTRQAEHKIHKDRKSLVINYQQFENTNEVDARGTRHWCRERKWMERIAKENERIFRLEKIIAVTQRIGQRTTM